MAGKKGKGGARRLGVAPKVPPNVRVAQDVLDMADEMAREWSAAALHDVTRGDVFEACIRDAYTTRETVDLASQPENGQPARKVVARG